MNLVRPIVFAMVAAISISGLQSRVDAGDLHQKTIRDWKRATPQNRLETAADFIAVRYEDKAVIAVKAVELLRCINEGGADAHSNNQSVTEFAAMCMVLMGTEN